MYGKKRIVINKRNQIIVAGDKTWNAIGILVERDNGVVAKFLIPENRWDSKLTDDNSISYGGVSKTEARRVIGKIYNIPK